MKMKVKGFQIRLVGVHCTSPEKKNAKETWVEIQEGKDILKYPPVTRSRLGGRWPHSDAMNSSYRPSGSTPSCEDRRCLGRECCSIVDTTKGWWEYCHYRVHDPEGRQEEHGKVWLSLVPQQQNNISSEVKGEAWGPLWWGTHEGHGEVMWHSGKGEALGAAKSWTCIST